jgi:hypothetical protein
MSFPTDSVLNSSITIGSMTFFIHIQDIIAYQDTTKRITSMKLPLFAGQNRMMCALQNSQRITIVILQPPRTLIILFWKGQDFVLNRISLFPEKLLDVPHILTVSDRFIYVEPTVHISYILDLNGQVLYSKKANDSISATFFSSQLLIVYENSTKNEIKSRTLEITEFFPKSTKMLKRNETCQKCKTNVSGNMLHTCTSCTTTCCIPCLSSLDFCISCAKTF